MTKEEAIKIINYYDMNFYDLSGEKIPADKLVEAFDMAIEALQRTSNAFPTHECVEPTHECVEKQVTGKLINVEIPTKCESEEAEKQVKGKWITDGHHIRCDQCGIYFCNSDREGDALPRNFCPNCGADMRGEEE